MAKTKLKPAMTCEVDGCEREVVACGLCGPCYQAERKWGQRTVADRRERKRNLEIYQQRLDRLSVPRLRRVK
jgi:hypothetical protein